MPNDPFEVLKVWRRSRKEAVRRHLRLRGCRDSGFHQQIADSVGSLSTNIAEDTGCHTEPGFRRFPGYAEGSAGETQSRPHIAARIGYTPPAACALLRDELRRISRMIKGLTDSLQPT
ncbi:MAG: four helix bundle protein [Opitutaceae bacterium]|nr:four helix bundle protein [Opitutaceae bacterium]